MREALSEVMAAKEKNAVLFDSCKKAAAMKQIKIAHGRNLLDEHNFSVSRHFPGLNIAHNLI